jgi:hypothetical protein
MKVVVLGGVAALYLVLSGLAHAETAPPLPPGYPPPSPGYGYYVLPEYRPGYPEDAAVRSTPFADILVVSNAWQRRFSEGLSNGGQVGTYLAGRVRLAARLAFLTETVRDDQEDSPGRSSKAPSFLYGASAGFVVFRSPHFALSPGLLFARTNVSDYGTMLGLSVPFEWVTNDGVRLGLEIAGGSVFGGSSAVSCSLNCDVAPVTFEDRQSGGALWLQFQVGFGIHHPAPLVPR